MHARYVPAAILGLICIISFSPYKYPCKVGIIIPNLQMWKLSHREIKGLTQGHRAHMQ